MRVMSQPFVQNSNQNDSDSDNPFQLVVDDEFISFEGGGIHGNQSSYRKRKLPFCPFGQRQGSSALAHSLFDFDACCCLYLRFLSQAFAPTTSDPPQHFFYQKLLKYPLLHPSPSIWKLKSQCLRLSSSRIPQCFKSR